jgi:hypothetical protein
MRAATASHTALSSRRKPFTWSNPRVEHGPTLAYDEQATAKTLGAVKAFLSTTFKLQPVSRK